MLVCQKPEELLRKIHNAFMRNRDLTDPKEIQQCLEKGDYIAKELEALYSLQSLVTSLEHPNKLLHSVFDVLYDCDVISEVRLKLAYNMYTYVKVKILFLLIDGYI